MADITMCTNTKCPLNENCYRYMATPSYYQAYSSFSPDEEGNCESYWPITDEEDQ